MRKAGAKSGRIYQNENEVFHAAEAQPAAGAGGAMNLVEIFLPVCDNNGRRFPEVQYQRVKAELLAKFAGLTAYARSPGEGLWREGRGLSRDGIIIYEVMVNRFQPSWWRRYRKDLEKRFRQKYVVIRCFTIKLV